MPSLRTFFVNAERFDDKPRVGDVMIYGPGDPEGSHAGLVEEVLDDGTVITLDGNWSDKIVRVRRSPADIVGFGHPPYSTEEASFMSLSPEEQKDLLAFTKATNAAVGRLEIAIRDPKIGPAGPGRRAQEEDRANWENRSRARRARGVPTETRLRTAGTFVLGRRSCPSPARVRHRRGRAGSQAGHRRGPGATDPRRHREGRARARRRLRPARPEGDPGRGGAGPAGRPSRRRGGGGHRRLRRDAELRRRHRPPDIAASVDRQGDRPDGFVVWNDEVYGDTNGDGLAELPVSRAPDGGSVAFLAKVLGATTTTSTIDRSGVRNFARPFAELVFGALPGADPLLVSIPVLSDSPSFRLDGRMVYVMLHGDHHDTSQFEGEKENRQRVPAATLANVPTENAGVVLAGCCWGGLISNEIASECPPEKDPGQRSPENSMAMKFLEGGSIAFVGCTGLHYSPMKEPFEYNGRPMHESFWRHVLAGDPPAVALHKARDEFGAAYPTGRRRRSASPSSPRSGASSPVWAWVGRKGGRRDATFAR